MEIKSLVKTDFLSVDEEASLGELMGQLKQYEKRSALVFKKNKYLGMIEKKSLLKSRLNVTEEKLTNFLKKTPVVTEEMDVIDVAYMMFQSDLDYVPVERNKKVIGILHGIDLVNSALDLPEMKKVKVNDVKIINPSKVDPLDPVAEVLNIMYREHVDHVPVFEKGKLSGVISYKDLMRKYLNWTPRRDVSAKFNKMASSRSAQGETPHFASLPVSNFSTNDNLLTIQLGEGLKSGVSKMAENNVWDLLVLQEEKYQGLLTVKNILRYIGSLKIPQKFNIKFVGLHDVDMTEHEEESLLKIAESECFKLQRKFNQDFKVVINLKAYNKGGKQKKFSVHMKFEAPGKMLVSEEVDWDLETALHRAFNNAKSNLKDRHRDDSFWQKSHN